MWKLRGRDKEVRGMQITGNNEVTSPKARQEEVVKSGLSFQVLAVMFCGFSLTQD